jgi:hypothetical protein
MKTQAFKLVPAVKPVRWAQGLRQCVLRQVVRLGHIVAKRAGEGAHVRNQSGEICIE